MQTSGLPQVRGIGISSTVAGICVSSCKMRKQPVLLPWYCDIQPSGSFEGQGERPTPFCVARCVSARLHPAIVVGSLAIHMIIMQSQPSQNFITSTPLPHNICLGNLLISRAYACGTICCNIHTIFTAAVAACCQHGIDHPHHSQPMHAC